MTASQITVLGAIETALGAIDGTGDYATDVAGAGGVQRWGSTLAHAALPLIVAKWERENLEDMPTLLTTRQLEILISAFPDASTAGTELEKCSELAADINRALYADRTLGGVVIDLFLESLEIMPPSDDVQRWGVDCRVRVHYRTDETDPETIQP